MKNLVCAGILLLAGPALAAMLKPAPLIVEIQQIMVEATVTDDPSKRLELIRKALNTAQGFENVNGRAEALSKIAIALAEFGDISGALKVLASIEHSRSSTAALPAIAVAQARAGNVTEALRTVRSEFRFFVSRTLA